MDMARDSISASEPVWFGCEVSKRWLFKDLKIDLSWRAFSRYVAKQGFLDLTAHDYQLVFGVEVNFQCSFLWPPISSCLTTRFKLGWTRRPGWCLGIAWWPMPWSSLGAMWRVALSPGESIHGIPQSCPSFPFHQTLLETLVLGEFLVIESMFLFQMEGWKQLGWGQRRERIPSHDIGLVQGWLDIFCLNIINYILGVCVWNCGWQEVGAKGGSWDGWEDSLWISGWIGGDSSNLNFSSGELEPVVLPAWDPLGALAL